MATIGSDGSEGSEGSEQDALLAMDDMDLATRFPVDRKMFRVDLKGVKKVNADVQAASDDFWTTAKAFGMLNGSVSRANGDTTLFIPASNEAEVKKLVDSDPIIAGGNIKTTRIKALG